jgi:hypothetical protein
MQLNGRFYSLLYRYSNSFTVEEPRPQPSRPRLDSLDQTSVVSFVFSQFPCALDLYRFFLISFLFGKKNVVVNFFFPAKRFIGKKMLLFFMKFSRNSSTNW